MPQYVMPQQKQAQVLTAQANALFSEGESAAGTADTEQAQHPRPDEKPIGKSAIGQPEDDL
jgi:hypothetical protein